MKKVFCILMMAVLLCTAALAESELTVNGKGIVYVTADRVSVSMGVSLTGDDVAQTQREVNERIAAVCKALTDAGLDENSISTNSIYIYPQYDYSSSSQELIGYSVSTSITIRTDSVERVGEYIDAAFAAGANTFDSINFSASNTEEARKQALEIAVKNAMEKAQVIAAAAGKTLGNLEEITEGEDYGIYAAEDNGYGMSVKAEAASGTSVHAAQIGVSANVKLQYEMK